jgi:hypothetical protein
LRATGLTEFLSPPWHTFNPDKDRQKETEDES